MLSQVEWGEYKIGNLFTSANGNFDIQKTHINGRGNYVITAGLTDNGVLGKTDIAAKVFSAGTITIDMFGNAFFRQFDYKLVTHARVFSLKSICPISNKQGLFISNSLRYLSREFGYENMCSFEKIKQRSIFLPVKNGEIDFDFMERFVAELEAQRVAELEAYLTATGLKDYELTAAEQKALDDFENQRISWKAVTYQSAFDHIKQGRRLKKEDQLPGSIPFVMAGTTNTGVVNYISNPVASFPKNSITIDIFGNAFYRNYAFGAGDDTGVYWNTQADYTSKQMLFFTSSMEKSIAGKFSYGKKLRSSQSLDIKMYVPSVKGGIDLNFMDTLISAIQKLIIKDVVKYSDRKIAATKQCCKHSEEL